MAQTIVKLNMEAALEPQLANAPRDAEKLHIYQDVPTNNHWALLSKHFTSVKDLHIDSGWNEAVNDRDIPLHWPLEKLTYTSACGEVVQSPWILEGRVSHLVLNYTSGLKFEGPTNDSLCGPDFLDGPDFIDFGNRRPPCPPEYNYLDLANCEQGGPLGFPGPLDYLDLANREQDYPFDFDYPQGREQSGPPRPNSITVIYIPDLAAEWRRRKHANPDNTSDEGDENDGPEPTQNSSDDTSDAPDSQLKTLEIIHNDVRDTLCRYVDAHPGVLDHIETLSLIADTPNDMNECNEDFLEEIFPQLEHLKTLVLVLGDDYADRGQLPYFFKSFPPSLETLRFQSSVSLARDDVIAKWVDAFKDPAFLPHLKKLSFVLDLDVGDEDEDSTTSETPAALGQIPSSTVSDDALALAKRACERVERAAESRGVIIEPFMGEWRQDFTTDGFTTVTSVDERWDKL